MSRNSKYITPHIRDYNSKDSSKAACSYHKSKLWCHPAICNTVYTIINLNSKLNILGSLVARFQIPNAGRNAFCISVTTGHQPIK